MTRVVRVEVDKQSCLSSGRCVEAAPGAFRFDADYLAEATEQALALADEELHRIARTCPGLAIALHGDDDVG